MPWNEGSSGDPSENLFSDLVLGTIWTGVGAIAETAKLGYNYVSDPQNRENTAQNAKQFAQNFGKYRSNGRDWFFSDFNSSPSELNPQIRQLREARYQRSQGIQTGFDDEEDNIREDSYRSNWEKSQRSNRYRPTTGKSYDNPKGNFSPNTVVSSALRNYKQVKQQSNYAGNSYTSYADLRRSLPDYQSPQYQRYQASDTSSFSDELGRQQQASEARSQQAASLRELKQREWATKHPEIDALARESDAFAKEASAHYQRFANSHR